MCETFTNLLMWFEFTKMAPKIKVQTFYFCRSCFLRKLGEIWASLGEIWAEMVFEVPWI